MTTGGQLPVAWFKSAIGTTVPLWHYEAADRLSRETPQLVVWGPSRPRSG